jgi:uncharacterized membrane protein YkvA (DUF1232 family)
LRAGRLGAGSLRNRRRHGARSACARLNTPEAKVIFSAADSRFSIGWVRAWIAMAGMWTRDDWRWWCEIKAVALSNDIWRRWRSLRDVRSVKQEFGVFVTILLDWRRGFLAKLCLIGGGVLPFMPFDLIPNRIPVLGHLDEASYVLGGLFLARLLVPEELLPELPARNTEPTE